jgi:hypothetical protein
MKELIGRLICWLWPARLKKTNQRQHEEIMAKLNELAGMLGEVSQALTSVGAQLDKARVEIIAALRDNNPEIPPAALEKINSLGVIAMALKGASQALDDLNQDRPE